MFFRHKKTYNPYPITTVELAKSRIYALELQEEINILKQRIRELEYHGEYYD
jgi:hypothetical protein